MFAPLARLLPVLSFIVAVAAHVPAHALGQPYEQSLFDRLQAQGQPTLIWIHADWCPTCKAQGQILPTLLDRPELRAITVLKVDFDSQKPLVRHFRAIQQSTLVMYRGGREVGRSIGDTNPASLRALLARTP